MQPEIYNSNFLSPAKAVEFLWQKFQYKTSYRRISELMREGIIQSIPEDDYAEHKLPRIRTTEAALENWLKSRFREQSRAKGREHLNRASAAAALREVQEEAELAAIPEQHTLQLSKFLTALGVPTQAEIDAQKILAQQIQKAEARRLRKENKQRGVK
jgi:hypothetical protein